MEGYHFFVRSSGLVEYGRPVAMIGAHCYGENAHSIAICLSGLKEFTDKQFNSCAKICVNLLTAFPGSDIVLHRDIAQTDCPGFELYDVVSRVNKIMEIAHDVSQD